MERRTGQVQRRGVRAFHADLPPGDSPPKERCSLPVLEPNGDVNTNALGQAARRINQITNVTAGQRSAAARKLLGYYRQAGMDPPEALRQLARR